MQQYKKIRPFVFDCHNCPTPCDGVSKMVYNFKNDVDFSEHFEQKLIDYFNNLDDYSAQKTRKSGYPDLEVFKTDKPEPDFYLEVKVQQRTFMSVQRILRYSGLTPSETLALNLSDLLRYFEIQKKIPQRVLIVWVLSNRPCVLGDKEYQLFYQDSRVLEKIYQKEQNKRRFRRKSGDGDVVNGVHKGVVVNYHFSLNELKKFKGKI